MEDCQYYQYVSDKPIDNVCYYVYARYSINHPANEGEEVGEQKATPVNTYAEACTQAEELAKCIAEEKSGYSLPLSPEDYETGYYFWVIDEKSNLIAQIGIAAFDYNIPTRH